MQDPRPLLLVSNDDGHSSHFLRALVESLCERFDVCVVAPLEEQSWVGRAMTRQGTLEVQELRGWPCVAWSVSGRPADCVNIGLNYLVDRRPTAVVSGINLGFNASLPLALGSGTIAAATEGALAGLPAFAFSLALESHEFGPVSAARGRREPEGEVITRRAAKRATEIVHALLQETSPPYSVHNINFPPQLAEDAPLTQTELTLSEIPSLFTPQPQPEGDLADEAERHEGSRSPARRYIFSFTSQWRYTHNPERSDFNALKRGEISHTVLRWDRISSL